MNIYEGVDVGGPAFFHNSVYANAPVEMQSAPINGAQSSDVASASTINLDTATGNLVDVTGTTTITAITLSQGRERVVRFTGALTLTNGASLVLPGGANITTAAGDFAIFSGYASGVVRCVMYQKAATAPVSSASQSDQETATSTTTFVSPGTQQFHPSASKAWVIFQGTGTVTILASYNVSSITDNGVGDYTVNFTNAFSSANYAFTVMAGTDSGSSGNGLYAFKEVSMTSSALRINLGRPDTGGLADAAKVSVICFGDQ